jgi:hypothetical protein
LNVNIGRRSSGTYYFNGLIDDVRIANHALTQDQIQTDMVTPLSTPGGTDTVAPTAAITAPTGGASVSGTVTIAATASDNVGVAGVQFLLDNNPLGAEDTTSPYSISWNTTTASNGTHILRAVATDTAGNRSEPSRMLRGRALLPPPTPPTWVSAERRPAGAPAAVSLTWSHPTDSRLSSQIERRVVDGFLWVAITPWLTRGIYEFTDIPPDLSLAWEYRLRVRDQLGQMASELPIIALAALP